MSVPTFDGGGTHRSEHRGLNRLRLALADLDHEDVLLRLVHVVDDPVAVAHDVVEHLDPEYVTTRLSGRTLLHPGKQLLGDGLLVGRI